MQQIEGNRIVINEHKIPVGKRVRTKSTAHLGVKISIFLRHFFYTNPQ